jgi:polyferredoxin
MPNEMECPVGNKRCKCANCTENANINKNVYCIGCFECIDANAQKHDVYLCTGYKRMDGKNNAKRKEIH